MIRDYNLSGEWGFRLDGSMRGIEERFFEKTFEDTICLPTTTAVAEKGEPNTSREIGYLTDAYKYEGYAWFERIIEIDKQYIGKPMKLFLERTRITKLWINGIYVGTESSLCTPHIYEITEYIKEDKVHITILVDNTEYVTKGGHLTSPDTQTNWNGITGEIKLYVYDEVHIEYIKAYPDVEEKSVKLIVNMVNTKKHNVEGRLTVEGCTRAYEEEEAKNKLEPLSFTFELEGEGGEIELIYPLGKEAKLWSEYTPILYELNVTVDEVDKESKRGDIGELSYTQKNVELTQCTEMKESSNERESSKVVFGLRSFTAGEHYFLINGTPTFLRGKHDGMIFPLTGVAPTTVEEWLEVLSISKSYGVNHYRYHTCCPPDAAFTAADLLGIYMEPELPFWGTLTAPTDENHNEEEQAFLIREGIRMLDAFGNHPSFVMMSLGNELWGRKEQMAEIIRGYKARDSRHLYTEGSNNFQFTPVILEEDDFFVGVRFSRDRLIRGSYAMCDAPLGFVQTEPPHTMLNYDEHILPTRVQKDKAIEETEIEIQYGTGTKKVKAEETGEELRPNKPVVSHEIGQYAVFPNFKEIDKYTGVLKARNFEVFRERLEEKGLLDLADKYFYASGKLAVQCYKEELEAAMRSKFLAGYQILDLQDFSGQGTALVGILDAFMESKELITAEEWRGFCSDIVLLAQFEKYNYEAKEVFSAEIALSYYRPTVLESKVIKWHLCKGKEVLEEGEIPVPDGAFQLIGVGTVSFPMPVVTKVTKLTLSLEIEGIEGGNCYDLWVYPTVSKVLETAQRVEEAVNEVQQVTSTKNMQVIYKEGQQLYIVRTWIDAKVLLEEGECVLLLPNEVKKKLPGFYCTEFWCYPMFRSISESMNKPVPVGTMGLLIQNEHEALAEFKSECYSTPQWYEIVTASDCAILDDTHKTFRPIVQMIDNFERNHKLGILFEASVLKGKLLVCTSRLNDVMHHIEVRNFAKSIVEYGLSKDFNPTDELTVEVLDRILN